jgi:hypothetical protein
MPPPQPPYVPLMQQLIAELVALRQELAKSTAELAKIVEIAHGPTGGTR